MIRLDKYLADATFLTRKEAKGAIKAGRVLVEGEVARSEAMKLDGSELVTLDGENVSRQDFIYLMLHKPGGYVSATRDGKDKTVLDLIEPVPGHPDLFPVGRLDKDTEGLLLLTDDGEGAHRLLSPRHHVDKTYYLEYEGKLVEDAAAKVASGMDYGEEKPSAPGRLVLLGEGQAEITISEGKFHQVKRMIKALGGQVTYLKRLSMGDLRLDESLAPGQYRFLTEKELEILFDRK